MKKARGQITSIKPAKSIAENLMFLVEKTMYCLALLSPFCFVAEETFFDVSFFVGKFMGCGVLDQCVELFGIVKGNENFGDFEVKVVKDFEDRFRAWLFVVSGETDWELVCKSAEAMK